MPYPPAPWQLHGQLWVSLFRVREDDHPARRSGLYGAAFVSYEPPGQLTYSELLVATPTGRRATITDIWVDSPDSRDGGRALWAIPKDLASFTREDAGSRARRTTWRAEVEDRPAATARFTDVSHRAPRTPFRGSTHQVRADGSTVLAPIRGSARTLPCRASWTFDQSGPLAWLAGRRPLASFRMHDFAMTFGST